MTLRVPPSAGPPGRTGRTRPRVESRQWRSPQEVVSAARATNDSFPREGRRADEQRQQQVLDDPVGCVPDDQRQQQVCNDPAEQVVEEASHYPLGDSHKRVDLVEVPQIKAPCDVPRRDDPPGQVGDDVVAEGGVERVFVVRYGVGGIELVAVLAVDEPAQGRTRNGRRKRARTRPPAPPRAASFAPPGSTTPRRRGCQAGRRPCGVRPRRRLAAQRTASGIRDALSSRRPDSLRSARRLSQESRRSLRPGPARPDRRGPRAPLATP